MSPCVSLETFLRILLENILRAPLVTPLRILYEISLGICSEIAIAVPLEITQLQVIPSEIPPQTYPERFLRMFSIVYFFKN